MITFGSGDVKLRPLNVNDASSIAALADNIKIWNNVRDALPHPYVLQDAWNFIAVCDLEDPVSTFAVVYKGELAGVIGLTKKDDVYKLTAELGFWLGEPFWNKGIATQAVKIIIDYGFEQLGLVRICSCVFDFNKASQRVLEKSGFVLEGIFKNAVIKNNKICDEYRYAILK